MKRLKLFYVKEQYICYLRKFEHKISENQNSRRPYCGAVIFNQKILYFIPFSSPKEKYKKMGNSLDIEKIWNGDCGILNLNNMIPVPEQEIQEVNISQIEDEKYRRLLKRQADYIRAYSEKIQNKAEKLYDLVVKGQPRNSHEKNILARCCDFMKLEKEMQHYKKRF